MPQYTSTLSSSAAQFKTVSSLSDEKLVLGMGSPPTENSSGAIVDSKRLVGPPPLKFATFHCVVI